MGDEIKPCAFAANGREYRAPARPIVVICLDGSSDEYLDAALIRGRTPNLARMIRAGHRARARSALPSFTNPNNASIITGVSPAIHAINGNFFLDPASREAVMMNDERFLRADTIPARAAAAGRRCAVVTAKDKLRAILAKGLDPRSSIALSIEKARDATPESNGIERVANLLGHDPPPIYSAGISVSVLALGAALLERNLADLLYLSTTDYIQHMHPPEHEHALALHAAFDEQLGRMLDQGAIIALTADHGMNAKHHADGTPNVLYLDDLLTPAFADAARVILPITDPYVAHHGALGSYATIHLRDAPLAPRVRDFLLSIPGITEVHERAIAASLLELDPDRVGDIVVMSARNVAIGTTPALHDLSALSHPLRSHGGRYEEMVPLIISEPLRPDRAHSLLADPRNFDAFELALNATTA